MFTGIVMGVGRIVESKDLPQGQGDQRIRVDCSGWECSDIALGDSICHNGVCLTVVAQHDTILDYDVSAHTLSVVCGLAVGDQVNLEKSLRAGDHLSGHYVSGHVDGIGMVTYWEPRGDSWFLEVEVNRELGRFIAQKGSVTVHGVSLTVNVVRDVAAGTRFQMNIVPHTREVTAFRAFTVGMQTNIEIDMLARYVERMLSTTQGGLQSL